MRDYSKTSQEVIKDELMQLRTAILENLARFGRNATGETGRSLRVQMNAGGGTLFGRSFFSTLEVGRGPTRDFTPHNPTLFQRILQWVQAKGIYPDDQRKTQTSLAIAITKRIHKSGTMLFRKKQRQDIYSTAVQRAIKNINARLLEEAVTIVSNIHLHLSETYQ